jgi:hypothetical protein
MLTTFLRDSKVIEAIYKQQKFSCQSLEYIVSLYAIVLPELQDPTKRLLHFDIIRKILAGFEFESMKVRANTPMGNEVDFEHLWTIVLGYLITATAKDFTIIIRIVDN